MTSKLCKYGCGCLLEGFDEEQRKFLEAGTGGLHTKERCQEAKAKLAQKNDHGNEEFNAVQKAISEDMKAERFVDHTLKGQSKVKIFVGTPMEVEGEYNDFLAKNNGKIKTQGAQFQLYDLMFAIALYYEETKQ